MANLDGSAIRNREERALRGMQAEGDIRATDRFGNEVDPAIGYARGAILASAEDDLLRFQKAQNLIRRRVAEGGRSSVAIFTGNRRDFPLAAADLPLAEEWIGPSIFGPSLESAIRTHLGASAQAETAVFNRTSGALVAAVLALAYRGLVIAFTESPAAPHPSVFRGAVLAGAELQLAQTFDELEALTLHRKPDLLVLTPVSSELDVIPNAELERIASWCSASGVTCLIDDAYGARFRPVFLDGPKSLETGADIAVSNSDKAGLDGPRGGFMAGRSDLIRPILACALELAQEARSPISLGVLKALERYEPGELLAEAREADQLSDAVAHVLGSQASLLRRTPLGPSLSLEGVLEIVMGRAGKESGQVKVVPSEASAALAMMLLRDHGILLVAAAGGPGARPTIRLKPTAGAIAQAGGVEAVSLMLDEALTQLAGMLDSPEEIRRLVKEVEAD